MTAWTPGVSTLYRNAEVLAAARSPRSASLRLGLSWGFGLPADGPDGGDCPSAGDNTVRTEFSFPLRAAGDLPDLLRRRGGLDIRVHADPGGTGMLDYLRSTGEPVIAVVDSFYLPYRPACRRVHSSRTVIVTPVDRSQVWVDDCWEPVYLGLLNLADLDAARRSPAEAEPLLEPVFTGVQADAEWFTVCAEPVMVADPARWAASAIGTLAGEITEAARTDRTSFGLAALRELAGGGAVWQTIPRRTLALVLRAELSSRAYLCTLLRNAVTLVGQPALVEDVNRYQQGLRHFQAARDVAVKSLRRPRAEYDEFVLARWRDALSNEERLLAAITAAGLSAEPVAEELPFTGSPVTESPAKEAAAWAG